MRDVCVRLPHTGKVMVVRFGFVKRRPMRWSREKMPDRLLHRRWAAAAFLAWSRGSDEGCFADQAVGINSFGAPVALFQLGPSVLPLYVTRLQGRTVSLLGGGMKVSGESSRTPGAASPSGPCPCDLMVRARGFMMFTPFSSRARGELARAFHTTPDGWHAAPQCG